jgi:hypothetical protein
MCPDRQDRMSQENSNIYIEGISHTDISQNHH